MKELFGYKIVNKDLSSLTRCKEGSGLQYEVDKWVTHKGNCGPLAVFDTRKRAIRFAYDNFCGYLIYRVKYTKSPSKALWDNEDSLVVLPYGTLLAAKVMLLKRCHIRRY
jgi:hypothetical protein